MNRDRSKPAAPDARPDTAEYGQSLEFERRIFHLRTLFEASMELSAPADARTTLRRFLPIAMGPLGLTFGFAVMVGPDRLQVESLGLETEARERFERAGAGLVDKFFPDRDPATLQPRPTVLTGQHLANDPNLPAGTSAVVAIQIDERDCAILVLGPKLTGVPYGEDEIELLQGLAANLSIALKRACADERVSRLNADLKDRNLRMEQTLESVEQAREELGNHAFRLQTLYETTLELSSLNNPEAILNAFLLTAMGTFSYSTGWIALYGPEFARADIAYRGPDPDEHAALAAPAGREQVLARFVDLKDRMPQTNQSMFLDDAQAVSSLPAPAELGILFSLDDEWHGAIGLGSPLSSTPMTQEMRQLLRSLMGTFIVTLGNAKHCQRIHGLNTALSARNAELQATLDALTTARQEVTVQTEAKERIIGLVHGEVERVWRASWRDVCLIILAGIVLGALFNATSPSGVELVPQALFEPPPVMIDAGQAHSMVQGGKAVLIDARPADFHRQQAIPDSINLPKDLFDFVYSMKLAAMDPETTLIVYGRTISRHYDAEVARELRLLGHGNVLVVKGGLAAWEAAGYEVTP
jgi:rhodanese-related sulfurtransferase/transcriptional regulator with GAF, ATPase, and Fis domain